MFSTLMDLMLIVVFVVAMFNMCVFLGRIIAEYWEEIFHG